jgi:hypothetical protein
VSHKKNDSVFPPQVRIAERNENERKEQRKREREEVERERGRLKEEWEKQEERLTQEIRQKGLLLAKQNTLLGKVTNLGLNCIIRRYTSAL